MDINTVNEGMSLAEALQMRADIKTRISQLHSRLNDNAKVQEGEAPAEDPLRLIELLSAECEAYETLIRRINLTNAATVFEGETLTALLARRDTLSLELSIMRDFLQQASQLQNGDKDSSHRGRYGDAENGGCEVERAQAA